MRMNERITWVDCARGIGILLVVYGHVARGVVAAGLMDGTGLYRIVDSLIYSFHMPLFFFVSGMFFPGSLKSKGLGLLKNKVALLVYPYFIWSVIQTGVKILMGGHTNHAARIHDLVTLLWLPVEQFWFLYSLFLIFVLEILCFTTLKKAGVSQRNCALLAGGLSVALFFLRPWLPGVFQLQTVAGYMVYFHGGVCFFIFAKGGGRMLQAPLAWGLVFGLSAAAHLVWQEDSAVLYLLLAFSGTFLVISLSNLQFPSFIRAFSRLGRYSMEIYLVHILAASGFRIVLFNILHIAEPGLHLAGGLVAGLLLPVLFVKFCGRFPVAALLFSPGTR
jgi:fucose 4-O-acetylase-like acetyltransferase